MKQFTWADLVIADNIAAVRRGDEASESYDDAVETIRALFDESEISGAFHMIPITITDVGIAIPDDFDTNHWYAVLDVYNTMIESTAESLDDVTDEEIRADRTPLFPTVSDEIILAGRNYERSTRDERGADDGTYDYCGSYVDAELEWIDILLHDLDSVL